MKGFLYIQAFFFLAFVMKGDNYVKVEVNEKISVELPSSFSQLTQEEINQRYNSPRKPLLFYSDPYKVVDFSVNMAYSLWGMDDIELLRSFYRSTLMSMYDEVEFITDEVRTINGHQFAVFEFVSRVVADDNAIIVRKDLLHYTFIQYTIVEGNNTALFNFTCPKNVMDKWQPTADKIMASVKIK